MTDSTRLPTRVYDYLDADMRARFAQNGHLSPEDRSALAQILRRELASYAAYIPSNVVLRQLANPQPFQISGEFWEGSILFADLSGFTYFCEQLSVLGKQGAEEVSTVVNQLFNALVAQVIAYQGELLSYNGELLKFGGDALTAFFNAETLGPAHAAAATLAALGMQEKMAAFSQLETRLGAFQLRLRVGVHSGRVFAAEVGDTDHIELVVTGGEVSRVARAQQIAAPGDVVISDQTALLLDRPQLLPRQAGFYEVRGLAGVTLPPSQTLSFNATHDDMCALELMVQQLTALRPYLVRDLPRRFLEETQAEIGEFRPVTVLFIHLQDFGNLLPLFGDDAMLAATALNTYFRRVQALIHRYGGIINKVDMYTSGDKLMALFGAPSAHEDDPQRAVRCALELETTLAEVNAEIADLLQLHGLYQPYQPGGKGDDQTAYGSGAGDIVLRQRIGINTGTVFAGRVGGARRYEYTVMGPAVNLAARLMESAGEGDVLLSPETRREVEHEVLVVEQAPIAIKGIDAPIVPARALNEEYVPATIRKASFSHAPLIGRDADLALLVHTARQALKSSGRVMAVVGDVGLGKTRLAEELVRSLVLDSISLEPEHTVPSFRICTGEGQSFKQSIPFITLRPPLNHLLGVTMRHDRLRDEGDYEKMYLQFQSRVDQLAPEFSHFMPLLGDVLGITLPETPLTRSLSPEQRHDRIQELVVALFLGAAAEEPLLLVIDDVQWADMASQQLLAQLAQLAGSVPLLLMVCYRSDSPVAEPWKTLDSTLRLELHELSPEHSAALIEALLEGTLPLGMEMLLERTQGNPFFIQELVRALVSSGALAQDGRGRWMLTRPADQVALPTSVEGLIMARLDRLSEPYYELVQVASVIGQRFTLPILEGVYRNNNHVDDGLRYLIEADIIELDDQHEEPTYLFRHALLHNVAYEGILYAQRRELHRRVAQHIEALNLGHSDEHIILLTRHYLLAEDWEPAFRYHVKAGIQAQQRHANQDALDLFKSALEIAPHLHTKSDNGPLVNGPLVTVDLFTALKPQYALILQVIEIYERTGYIFTRMGEHEPAMAAYQEGLQLLNLLDAEQERCVQAQIACTLPKIDFLMTSVRIYHQLAALEEQRANYDQAFTWLHLGMEHITTESHSELARYYVLGARIYLGQGQFDEALDWARMGFAVAEYLDNVTDQAHALLLMGTLWRDKAQFALSIPALEQARDLLDQLKDAPRLGEVLRSLGDAYRNVGRWQDAIKCYQKSLQISENIGDVLGKANTSNNLALVMVGRGELDFATELFTYSSEQFRHVGSLLGLAITGCRQGEVLMLQGKPRDAFHLLRVSITSLENLHARSFLPEALRLAAEALLLQEETEAAAAYAHRSLEIAIDMGMTGEEAIMYRVMGQVALNRHDLGAASEYLRRSHTMVHQLDNQYELGKVLYWQAQLAYAQGNPDTAAALLREAEQVLKALRARRDIDIVRTFAARVAAALPEEAEA